MTAFVAMRVQFSCIAAGPSLHEATYRDIAAAYGQVQLMGQPAVGEDLGAGSGCCAGEQRFQKAAVVVGDEEGLVAVGGLQQVVGTARDLDSRST